MDGVQVLTLFNMSISAYPGNLNYTLYLWVPERPEVRSRSITIAGNIHVLPKEIKIEVLKF